MSAVCGASLWTTLQNGRLLVQTLAGSGSLMGTFLWLPFPDEVDGAGSFHEMPVLDSICARNVG